MLRLFVTIILIFASAGTFAKGWIDVGTIERVQGWACDVRFPDDQVDVHVWRDDNKFLGGTTATIYREPAVGAACGSGHSSHGFYIDLYFGENLKDGRNHRIHVYLIGRNNFVEQLNNSPIYVKYPGVPQERPYSPGDIVGRDLELPIITGMGHLGIWDGLFVVEALNEGNGGIHKNSYDNFWGRTNAWPIIRSKWPTHEIWGCFNATCEWVSNATFQPKLTALNAMMKKMNQIIAIGSDYSWDVVATRAVASGIYNSRYFDRPPRRGVYRCDTFILDLLNATVSSDTVLQFRPPGGEVYRLAFMSGEWWLKYRDMLTGVVTPVNVYNKIKAL